MSEMTAMRMTTVSPVSGHLRTQVAGTVLIAAVAAEAGRRLLTPRAPVGAPAAVDVRDWFSEPELARGRDFARPQRGLALVRSGLELAALTTLVRRPPEPLRRPWSHPVAGGAVTAAGLSLALTLPGLPLRALGRRRSLAVGLDTQSWGGWAADLAKAATLSTAFSAAAGAGTIALTRRWPRRWWLPAGVGSVAIGGLLGALAPVLLDPIFNDFEPLPEGETRSDVLALAHDAGVNVGEVFAVDASRRTSAANAYVSGLGPTKRVVLYDTMLDRYSRDEIRLVVAHELGHMRHRDVARQVAYLAVVAPAITWGIQRAAAALAGSDPRAPLGPGALPALVLAASVVSSPLGPIGARLSRAMERRADEFSLQLAGAPDAFISFERRASLQNLSDLEPRWLARQLASHPPATERIGAALAFAQRTGEPVSASAPAPA
jgi:STE24 endopeptidase